MKRTLVVHGLLALSLGVVPAGAGSSAVAQAPPDDGGGAVEVIASGLIAEPRADFDSVRQARCVARGLVHRLGIRRLEELRLDSDEGQVPVLSVPGLTEAERHRVAVAYDTCFDFERRDIEGFVAEGLSEAEGRCVSASYRASGIPEIHLTEPPHGVSGIDTEEARAHLDDFLTAAKAACRDWVA